jgi:hypothetical protein
MNEDNDKNEKEEQTYDKDAYVRHLCEGLNGKGCGTSYEYISRHRKQKTWEEKRLKFLSRQGD